MSPRIRTHNRDVRARQDHVDGRLRQRGPADTAGSAKRRPGLPSTRDNPAGTAAWQEAPQAPQGPATVPSLAGDRCGHRAGADRRDHSACCPRRNQAAARLEARTDRDGQRAGAPADGDGHRAPAGSDRDRHGAEAGPDRHRSVPAPRPALWRCLACPAVPVIGSRAGETAVAERGGAGSPGPGTGCGRAA